MSEFLYSIDKGVLLFVNQVLATPVGDVVWPLVTNYDRLWAFRIPLALTWVALLVFGGKRGRTVAIMIPVVILLCDKLSSAFIKEWVGRARPCHEIDGVPVVQGLRMLVDCGPGKSFPSSHAVNNFAIGTLFAFYYPRWKWAFFGWATLVAYSRLAVGVHYLSDVLGGAAIGIVVSLFIIWIWQNIETRLASRVEPSSRNTT